MLGTSLDTVYAADIIPEIQENRLFFFQAVSGVISQNKLHSPPIQQSFQAQLGASLKSTGTSDLPLVWFSAMVLATRAAACLHHQTSHTVEDGPKSPGYA